MATIKRERFMGIKQKKFFVKDVEKDVVKELTENQRVIFDIIKSSVVKDVVETAGSIAKKINKSERTVQRELSLLKDKNLIRRVGSRKQGYWEIV